MKKAIFSHPQKHTKPITKISARILPSIILLLSLICLFSPFANSLKAEEIPVIVMCRPLVNEKNQTNQIKNIEILYEKDIMPLKRLILLCVYHEDELTDYKPAFDYVKKNKLNWVKFRSIKGRVVIEEIFKRNIWTEQFKEIFDNSNGIIFTGGADLPPSLYGEETSLLTDPSTPVRSLYELSFVFHLIGGIQNPDFYPFLLERKKYPILGICLGAQTINIGAGGTLYQDIPWEIYELITVEQVLKLTKERIHSNLYIEKIFPQEKMLMPAFHRIKLSKKGIFITRMKMRKRDKPYVLSSHHQALKKLGKNLRVSARSIDGKVIEAIEHSLFPNVLGVQFHPEKFSLYQKSLMYKKDPTGKQTINLKSYLESHPPSMTFHKKIWHWFASCLNN